MTSKSLVRRLVGIPWPPLLAVSLVVLIVITLVAQRAVRTQQTSPGASLAILVSGDTEGTLIPCNCLAAQPGGLARRGEIVRTARSSGAVLYADLGNAGGGDSPYDRFKFETILRGELAMGVAAHNIGPAEVKLGPAELHRLARELKAPFVSTNVRDAEGRPLAEPLRLVNIAGRRIAVLGVLSTQYATDAVKVVDPAEAAAAALAENTPRYDALLVLAYLPADELTALAARLPEKAVVVSPSGSDDAPGESRKPLAGAVGRGGRSLVRIEFAKDDRDRWTASEVGVPAGLPEDAVQLANLDKYHRQLEERDFQPQDTDFVIPLPAEFASTHRVAGTNSCRQCHAQECAGWDTSRHARAWQSLADRGMHFDPACQRCHTTGFGWEGGFASGKQSLGRDSVGCESCHGPSLAHVIDRVANLAGRPFDGSPPIRTPLVASGQCVHCHDAENSPGFDYESAWARIKHGQSGAAQSAGQPAESGGPVEVGRGVN
jgi:hypothetical protein